MVQSVPVSSISFQINNLLFPMSEADLAASGTSEELVRLSIGLETIADIIADLDQAIAKATNSEPMLRVTEEQAIAWALSSPFAREEGGIRPKTIAVVGNIEDSEALSKLQKLGYNILPAGQANGEIDILFITDQNQAEADYSEQAKIVWFADGQADTSTKEMAEKNNQVVIKDKCPFHEADRLRLGE